MATKEIGDDYTRAITRIARKANGTGSTQAMRVHILDKLVKKSEIESVVPNGFRIATLQEVALAYRNDPEFVEEGYKKDEPVWAAQIGTSQIGLQKEKFFRIDENGKFVKPPEDYLTHHMKGNETAYLKCTGSGQVIVQFLGRNMLDRPSIPALVISSGEVDDWCSRALVAIVRR